MRAAVIAIRAGLSPSVHRALFAGLRNHLDGEADLALLAHLASALGDPQASLRIGKTAIAKGKNLITYAYPIHTFPAYTPLREPPEAAMLLGIVESFTATFYGPSWAPAVAFGFLLLTLAVRPAGILGR